MVAAAVVGSAVVGAYAADKASDKQVDAANQARDAANNQNSQIRQDNAVWRQQGEGAVNRIGDLLGTSGNTGAADYGSLNHQFNAQDLKNGLAPNYDFMLQQGLGAAQNAGNASGFSGNTLKGINDYAQGYAGNAYQQAFNNFTAQQTNTYNRLSNLAGLGQTANQITAGAGTALTGQATNAMIGAGNASAAGTIGVGNAVSNGLSNYAGWNYLNGGGQSYTSPNYGGSYSNPSGSTYDYRGGELPSDLRGGG